MESTFDTEWMTEKPKGIRQFHRYRGYAKRHDLSILDKASCEALQLEEEIGTAEAARAGARRSQRQAWLYPGPSRPLAGVGLVTRTAYQPTGLLPRHPADCRRWPD